MRFLNMFCTSKLLSGMTASRQLQAGFQHFLIQACCNSCSNVHRTCRTAPRCPDISHFNYFPPAEVMKFNGSAPETINGRLAMIAVLLAASQEATQSDTVLQQLTHAPWWQYALFILFIYASLVPMLKGAKHEAFGIFSPRAEIANGRAAMLGFAILMLLEFKSGVPFF